MLLMVEHKNSSPRTKTWHTRIKIASFCPQSACHAAWGSINPPHYRHTWPADVGCSPSVEWLVNQWLREWVLSVITMLCVCPGAQQLLRVTWTQCRRVQVLIRASDQENLAVLRGRAQRKLQHKWVLSLVWDLCLECLWPAGHSNYKQFL